MSEIREIFYPIRWSIGFHAFLQFDRTRKAAGLKRSVSNYKKKILTVLWETRYKSPALDHIVLNYVTVLVEPHYWQY